MEARAETPDVAAHIEAARRRFLDRQLTVDFIAKRLKSFQVAEMKIPGNCNRVGTAAPADGRVWSGVATWERTLVSFCAASDGGDPSVVQGALARHRVMDFVAFVAIYCRDLGQRALALAILERSLVADRMEGGDNGRDSQYPVKLETPKPVTSTEILGKMDGNEVKTMSGTCENMGTMPLHSIESAPEKVSSLLSEDSVSEKDSTHDALSSSFVSHSRVGTFLAAGGMRLLHQWLVDATTPTSLPTTATPDNKQKERGRSPGPLADTSALLLPLLRFLCDIPFDWPIIMESKIDQCINRLRRQIKKLAEEETKDIKWKQKVRIVTGDFNIGAVKETLDRLKANWKKAYEEFGTVSKASSGCHVTVLFAGLKDSLLERQTILERDHCADRPEWLTKLQAEVARASTKRKRKSLSTSDLEKLERKKEGTARLKENLMKAQAQRIQFQAELREMSRGQTEPAQKNERHRRVSNRRVRWKDGISATSAFRKRELLEEVFIIDGRNVKLSVHEDAPDDSLSEEFDPLL